MDKQKLIHRLHAIGAIQMGRFEIGTDFTSPFYVDLQRTVSHPEIARAICEVFWEEAQNFSYDLLSGNSVIATSFATYIAWTCDRPLLLKREHQSEKLLGMYKTGQKALLIGDVEVFGNQTLDTIADLEEEGVEVRDTLFFIDLELGGRKKIKSRGYRPHACFTISAILTLLLDTGKIPGDQAKLALDFIEEMHAKKS